MFHRCLLTDERSTANGDCRGAAACIGPGLRLRIRIRDVLWKPIFAICVSSFALSCPSKSYNGVQSRISCVCVGGVGRLVSHNKGRAAPEHLHPYAGKLSTLIPAPKL